MTPSIQSVYLQKLAAEPSDMHPYMPTLIQYAKKCSHITEFGVRTGASTFAFLMAKPDRMISYDINYTADAKLAESLARKEGINYTFLCQNTLDSTLEPTDLLLLDDLHTYVHLSQELAKHGQKVRKYLVFHDTVSHATKDMKAPDEVKVPGKSGLLLAINEFMAEHPEWKIEKNFNAKQDKYGLMILVNTVNVSPDSS